MDPQTGGPCQGIRNSIREMKKLGIRNEVVCLDDPGSDFLTRDSFCVHPLEKGKGPWQYSSKLIPWLLKNLHRFDAVIVHGLWLYPSFATNSALKKFKSRKLDSDTNSFVPKLYVMPHGMLDPYFQNDPGRKIKALRNWIYWKLIEKNVISNASALLFTCEEELKLARIPFSPYKPKKELAVGYGLESPPIYTKAMAKAFQEKCGLNKEDRFLLFLSRIHEKKGVDHLLLAYTKLIEAVKSRSNTGFVFPKLVIAGPGLDTIYGKKMLDMVSRSTVLTGHVCFTGMLSGSAKWGAFYGCEAFILPSHQENFGIAVAESLACSKPVLISDKVNIWKEVHASNAGFVNSDTFEGTYALINDFISLTAAEKESMASRARSTFESYFDITKVARNFAEAIRN